MFFPSFKALQKKKKKKGWQKGWGYQVRLGLIQATAGLFPFKRVGIESLKSFMLRAVLKIVGTHTPLPNVLTSQDQLLLLALLSEASVGSWDICCSAREQSFPLLQRGPALPLPEVAQVKVDLWAPMSHPISLSPNSPVPFTKNSNPVQGLV